MPVLGSYTVSDVNLYAAEDACGFDEIVIEEYCDAFRLSDELGDGFVTYRDLPVILMRVGAFPRYSLPEFGAIENGTATAPYVFKRLEKTVCELDPEGENQYDFQFFLKLMRKWDAGAHKYLGDEELTNAFRILDLDRGGSVSSNELKQIMSIFGDKLTQEEADGMLDMADPDGSGQIDYEEFVAIILQQSLRTKKKDRDQ